MLLVDAFIPFLRDTSILDAFKVDFKVFLSRYRVLLAASTVEIASVLASTGY